MKKTIVLQIDSLKPELAKIRIAASLIKKGGLVAFPTETVYGLGANALNPKAVMALFRAKKRPMDNPPIVHISKMMDVYRLAETVPAKASEIMSGFWPGPLTLIFKRSKIVPDVTVASLDTIAIRMPKHNVALALIEESDCPISAPSANLAGKPSPTSATHVLADLGGRIDAVLDAGPTHIGVESTVLDLTVEPPQILRPGGTSYELLKKTLGEIRLSPVVTAVKALAVEKTSSPGVKYKHYAPDAEMIVIEGDSQAVVKKINELAGLHVKRGKKVRILCTDETAKHYRSDLVKAMGSRSNLSIVARNLFRLLRESDLEKADVILAEGVSSRGLGLAVMNRLRKASGYNIVKVRSH
jgi:L-threonylcarbamoyladenylate synthase